MKNLLLSIFIIIFFVSEAQDNLYPYNRLSVNDSIYLSKIPALTIPALYSTSKAPTLPASLDNSELPYFRSIFAQYGWSCGQASSICYNFTYEINRLRNLPANIVENLYPSHFAFNFFTGAQNAVGVNYMHTSDLLRYSGTPNIIQYGGMSLGLEYWMSGYDSYYQAMHNKIDRISSIYVGDAQGIQHLKHWLHDHLDGSTHGSLANFYTDLAGTNYLPPGTPEAGKHVITTFGPYNGHSMTIVGWNDSIRWDYNNDGFYTNDLDIDGDGIITVKDWEIGAVKIANSHGDYWADSGFSYVMYKVLAEEKADGGIWNKSVHVLDVKADYSPLLTYKITLKHTSRKRISLLAGVSSDTSSMLPQHTLEIPLFNYQGGDHYMQGTDTIEAHKTIEFGLDATSLLKYIEPGEPAKFFLQVKEYDPDALATGKVLYFALMDYTDEVQELPSPQSDVLINNNSITTLSVVHTPDFDKPEILTNELNPILPGQPYSCQLNASGGVPGYDWTLKKSYLVNQFTVDYPDVQGIKIVSGNQQSGFNRVPLDFSFPFYGQFYDTISAHVDGFLNFNTVTYPLPYLQEDKIMLRYEQLIAPLLNKDLRLSGGEQGIWYQGNADSAVFRWKANLQINYNNNPVDFTTVLYPDGRINFYFEDTDDLEVLNHITAISNGDGLNREVASFTKIFPKNGSLCIAFSPRNFSSVLEIDENGLLQADSIDPDKIYDVEVMASDQNEISDTKILRLSDNILFDYSISSGNDNQIDYGEEAHLSLEIKNISSQILENVSIEITISDPFIDILDATESVSMVGPGQSILLPDAFSFQLDNWVPDHYPLDFGIWFNLPAGIKQGALHLEAFAPQLVTETPVVVDGDNQRLDPGETAALVFPVTNYGQSQATGVTLGIGINDPYITVNSAAYFISDTIPAGGTSFDTLWISVAEGAPEGHQVEIEAELSANPGLNYEVTFNLLIGRYPLLIIDLDPQMLSTPVISPLIDELGVMHTILHFINTDGLDGYKNVMVFLGRKFNNRVLTDAEAAALKDHLLNGGNIYLEGGMTWHEDPQTELHDMFSTTVQPITWNPYDTIHGLEGTLAENMSFLYYGDMAYYNHYLLPADTAFTVLRASEPQHGAMIANNAGDYKTVASNIDLEGLNDSQSPSTKNELLTGILGFFGLELLTTGSEATPAESANRLTCLPNPVKDQGTLQFQLDQAGYVSIKLFDLTGKVMTDLTDSSMYPPGTHRIIFSASQLPKGIYICNLQANQRNESIKLVKIK